MKVKLMNGHSLIVVSVFLFLLDNKIIAIIQSKILKNECYCSVTQSLVATDSSDCVRDLQKMEPQEMYPVAWLQT